MIKVYRTTRELTKRFVYHIMFRQLTLDSLERNTVKFLISRTINQKYNVRISTINLRIILKQSVVIKYLLKYLNFLSNNLQVRDTLVYVTILVDFLDSKSFLHQLQIDTISEQKIQNNLFLLITYYSNTQSIISTRKGRDLIINGNLKQSKLY